MTVSQEQENKDQKNATPKFDLDRIKQHLHAAWRQFNIQLQYLRQCLSRFGLAGISWWAKTFQQLEERENAIKSLAQCSQLEEFTLDEVTPVFTRFTLPEEDIEQATWYQRAHELLTQFETELTDHKHFNRRTLEAALKELRFIKEANEFHQNYGLEHLQQRVAEMYRSLQKEIVEFKQLEKDKLSAAKEAEKTEQLKLEKEKAEAEAKKAMAQNIAIKEKRLAIAEEKKRKIAEKEAIEAKRIQQEEEAEIQAKQAEIERQKKLQDSYIELQLEEKIKNMSPETLLNLALEQIEKADSLSFMQGDLLQRIETLIQRHKPN